MWDLVKHIIKQLPADVIIVVIAIAGLVLFVWKLSALWTRFKALPCDINSKALGELQKTHVDKADFPCQAHSDKIDRHSVSVSKLETSIEYLAKSIESANAQLQRLSDTTPLTQQHSPLSITERGWEVVRKLGIDKMLDNNWERIRHLIESGVESRNAYDINEFCIKYAVVFPEKFLQHDEVEVLKNDAYIQGLMLMDYMKIIAVMARDRFFKDNNIYIDDIEGQSKE